MRDIDSELTLYFHSLKFSVAGIDDTHLNFCPSGSHQNNPGYGLGNANQQLHNPLNTEKSSAVAYMESFPRWSNLFNERMLFAIHKR